MNELLRAFGLQLLIDEISIKLQTFKIVLEESKPLKITGGSTIGSSGTWTLGSTSGSGYVYPTVYIPHVYWTFQTEFGQQYYNYMMKQQGMLYPWGGLSIGQSQQQISSQPGHIITTGAGTFGGLYSGYGLTQQQAQRASQSQQAQQAALYGQLQSPYKITSSGSLLLESPSSTVVIKNIEDDSDKKSWVKRIKEWVSGRTS